MSNRTVGLLGIGAGLVFVVVAVQQIRTTHQLGDSWGLILLGGLSIVAGIYVVRR